MNRIEELIKEKGYNMTSFSEKMGITRQNLYSILKNPSYPSLEKLAKTLDVPMWQLFVSPTEIQREDRSFMALVKDGSEYYHATTLLELEGIVKHLKENKKD